MPKRFLPLLITIAVAAFFATAAAKGIASTRQSTASTLAGFEARVLVGLNRIRIRHGLVPLRLNSGLEAASVQHSREMGAQGYFAHTSPDGTTFWEHVKQWYTAGHHASLSVGENLLWSTPNVHAARALRLWMSSPEHRANILAPGWREVGIGAVWFAAAPGIFGGLPVTIITTDFGVRH